MKDEAKQVLDELKLEARETLRELNPTLRGVMLELESHRRHNHDHEDFLIAEFRNVTDAVNRLTAVLERLS